MKLRHKVILITGGTSGIGEACSRHFAELGAKVVMASIEEEKGNVLAAELKDAGSEAAFVLTDVTKEESVANLVAESMAAFGRIDAVHCNAGVWGRGTVTDFTEADFDKIMGVNVKGALWAVVVQTVEASIRGDPLRELQR